jgi:subtilisin family serine protease
VKFLDASGSGSTANAVNAVDFAIKAKAALSSTGAANVRVLSNSWGGGGFSQTLLDEINLANSNDMLFVAAAGNSSSNNDLTAFYPASFQAPNVVAVAATDSNDALASFSNYGATSVHLGAPGVGITSTTIGNTYSTFSGTSMATPHVSGAAALVLSQCAVDTAGVKQTLLATVDVIPSLVGLTVSGGRLNVNTAIRNCASAPAAPPAAPTALTATAGSGQVALQWQASSGAASYNVKRGTVSGGEALLASGVSTPGYTDSTATNGVTYYYVVSAVSASGESANSNEASATPTAPVVTPPPAPTGLSASAGPGAKKITLTWSAAAGASSYTVLRSSTRGGPYAAIASGVAATTYTNTSVSSRTAYYYVVQAVNAAGTSGYSNEATATAR